MAIQEIRALIAYNCKLASLRRKTVREAAGSTGAQACPHSQTLQQTSNNKAVQGLLCADSLPPIHCAACISQGCRPEGLTLLGFARF